jgi:hypothetical protein
VSRSIWWRGPSGSRAVAEHVRLGRHCLRGTSFGQTDGSWRDLVASSSAGKRGRAPFTASPWTGTMVRRLMQLIEAAATRSGLPSFFMRSLFMPVVPLFVDRHGLFRGVGWGFRYSATGPVYRSGNRRSDPRWNLGAVHRFAAPTSWSCFDGSIASSCSAAALRTTGTG